MQPVHSDTLPTSIIIKSKDISDLKKHLPADKKVRGKALGLFDFDDTLAMSGHTAANHLGGLKWRDKLKKAIEALKQSRELHGEAPIYEYLTLFIAKSANVSAVQPEFASLIRHLEQDDIKVMVFTARGSNGKNAWYKLDMKGVDAFTEEQMKKAGIEMASEPALPPHERVYQSRMIFCQNNPKEDILSDLFAQKVFPEDTSLLIFADDKEDAIKKVKKVADDRKISYIGIHYTAVEAAEETEFDTLKSTIQLVNLFIQGTFLSKETVEKYAEDFNVKGISADDYFKTTVMELHRFFEKNGLYKPYKDPAEFYLTVSEVARKYFRPC